METDESTVHVHLSSKCKLTVALKPITRKQTERGNTTFVYFVCHYILPELTENVHTYTCVRYLSVIILRNICT